MEKAQSRQAKPVVVLYDRHDGHLTQLINESVKTNIYALKLRHNDLQGNITGQGIRGGGGRDNRSWRTGSLHMWLLWSKLSLAPLNSNNVDGTHGGEEMRGIRNLDGEVSKDTRDSKRKDELITCSLILINIED